MPRRAAAAEEAEEERTVTRGARLCGVEARVWGRVPGKEPEAGTVARDGAAAAGESG